MKERFAEYIDSRRKELDLSKTELARMAGISRRGLYKILDGDVEDTYLSTLIKLAIPLQVHPLMLMQQIFHRWEFPSLTSDIDDGAGLPDGTGFVGDITYPDNSIVYVGQKFVKIWRSQNIGKFSWEGCSLVCFDEHIASSAVIGELTTPEKKIPIPTTPPGETIDIEIEFTAPKHPCSVISYWKMVSSKGVVCFPNHEGLSCFVNVINKS